MEVTTKKIEEAEEQIYKLRQSINYDTRELTIGQLVEKYNAGIEYYPNNSSENADYYGAIYIPAYQQDFEWNKKSQSKLIESILLGLPIPLLFVAENKNGIWEMVEGSQIVKTLNDFLCNKLELIGLEHVSTLNNFKFDDLTKSRKNKFLTTPTRVIILSENVNDEIKKDIFERINVPSKLLKIMKKRTNKYTGYFTDFICSYSNQNLKFHRLTPIPKSLQKNQKREELILRYFAFSQENNYKKITNIDINVFLDNFLDEKNKELEKLNEKERQQFLVKYENEFDKIVDFVDTNFKYGFRLNDTLETKRVIFEAISLAVNLILKESKKINIDKEELMIELNKQEFNTMISKNTQMYKDDKLKNRVEYVVGAIKRTSK